MYTFCVVCFIAVLWLACAIIRFWKFLMGACVGNACDGGCSNGKSFNIALRLYVLQLKIKY